jgi:hypothetical protein
MGAPLIYSSFDDMSRKIFSRRARNCEKKGGRQRLGLM